jgi:hypothetical protein
MIQWQSYPSYTAFQRDPSFLHALQIVLIAHRPSKSWKRHLAPVRVELLMRWPSLMFTLPNSIINETNSDTWTKNTKVAKLRRLAQ